MKHAFALTTGALAFVAALVVSGCTKSASHPQQQGQADLGPAWKLTYSNQCADSTAEQCVARYGFTVTANHTWEVGPGPAGQVKTGPISDADFAELDQAITASGGLSALKAGCSQASAEEETATTETSVKITLTQRTTQKELCARENDAATPAKVLASLAKLADKYYPLPFPDACEEAAAALTALYAPIKSCQSDAECVYVTPGYNVITPGSVQFVITDSCQVTTPLVVANNAAVLASRSKLIEAYNQAQVACGNRVVRSDCTSYAGFNSGTGAPVCQQGACTVSPSAVIER